MKLDNIVFNCTGEFIKDLVESINALPIDPFDRENHPELILEAHSREKGEFQIYPSNKNDGKDKEYNKEYRVTYKLNVPEGAKNITGDERGSLSFDYDNRKYFLSRTNQTPGFLFYLSLGRT